MSYIEGVSNKCHTLNLLEIEFVGVVTICITSTAITSTAITSTATLQIRYLDETQPQKAIYYSMIRTGRKVEMLPATQARTGVAGKKIVKWF